MPKIVSIQFSKAGKLYDFNALDFDLKQGDSIIVETERGTSIGTVINKPVERSSETLPKSIAPIIRIANASDFAIRDKILQKEKEAFDFCLKKIVERSMDMKLVKVEYQFDGSKAVFFFTADGRVDFRDLVKDLAHTFHTRIEMRQIGVRDEAKMLGGIGICGRELCCSSFLRDFEPVSVKMAKEQNLALNPNKISGQCGRLLCCLDYEYETYCCLRKNSPKCGKRVRTVEAVGVIDKVNILTGNITLKLDDNKSIIIKRDDILDDGAPLEAKSAPESKPDQQSEYKDKNVKPVETQDKIRQQRPQSSQQEKKPLNLDAIDFPTTPTTPTVEVSEPGKTGDEATRPVKKRNRNRRHGHRKKVNKPQSSGEPTPSK